MLPRLVGVLSLLVATEARGFAPAHRIHEMAGRMRGRREVAITLKVDCVFYEEGPICEGSWRCRSVALDRRPGEPACRHRRGRAILESYGGEDFTSPNRAGFVTLHFADGGTCRLDGALPYFFTAEVPGMFGRYRCVDPAGVEVDQGVFGFRATQIGAPFRSFD